MIGGMIALTVAMLSCSAPYQNLTIETARPSQALLPAGINSLTLMNRSISDEFRNFNKDSLQSYFYARGFNANTIVLDSLAADTTLKVLGDLLYSSGRYDVVIPRERNFARDLKFFKIPEELDWNEVKSICEEYRTDALLVMERYYNKLITKSNVQPIEENQNLYSALIDSKYDAVVKVYDPYRQKVVRQIVVGDTISWTDSQLSVKELFASLPSVRECLIQTGVQVALDLDSRLSPVWVREKRGFFRIEKGDAARLSRWVSENDWQSAYDYWLPYTRSAKKALRSKAQYNLALASEMLGRIDEAIRRANDSYKTQYHTQTEQYLYKLGKRKEILRQFQKLEKQ